MSAIRLFGPSYELDLETFLRDIVFFDGNCYSCEELCGNSINCSENLSYLVKKVRQPCQHLLSNCFWMGEQSDCCELFRPLETETGLCFSANSLHTPGPTDQSQFILNQKTGPGRLQFKVSKDFNVYIHTPEDVPYINAPPDIKNMVILGSNLKIEFMVSEIENDPMLGTIPVEKRKCMFPRENIQGKMYRYYSYSGCVVDCRAEAQKKICNCTHHFMLAKYGTKTCNIKGLACLSKHSKTIGSLKSIESHKPGLVCSCIPSCTEHNHLIIETVHTLYEDGNYSLIGIYMKSLPTTRFRRYIVRNKLDLIVSLGGTAGLFLGASLLSIAEWFYFMVLRRSSKKCKTSANQINTVEKRRNEGHINNPISNSKNKALLIVPLNVQLY